METPLLEGEYVRLEPLSADHLELLKAIIYEPTNWKYMANPVLDEAGLNAWAKLAFDQTATGRAMVWVTVAKLPDGVEKVVGSTRFLDIDMVNMSVEIGHTWIGEPYRGTRANTEAKLLQLGFAFEGMGFERVAFKTHSANLRSQAALKAIGAHYEGTFRSHMLMSDGKRRDSAWFSIIRKEWPEVKELLERRLKSPLP